MTKPRSTQPRVMCLFAPLTRRHAQEGLASSPRDQSGGAVVQMSTGENFALRSEEKTPNSVARDTTSLLASTPFLPATHPGCSPDADVRL